MGYDNVKGEPDECDICLDWTFVQYHDYYQGYPIDTYYYAEMSWHYDSEQWFTKGYKPKDGGGIYYEDSMWEWHYEDDLSLTTRTSEYVEYSDSDLVGGIPCLIQDRGGCGCDPDDPEYFGVYLDPIGDWDPNQRWVQGQYIHTHNQSDTTTETSVSIGSEGFTVSFSSVSDEEVETVSTSTEGDGSTPMRSDQVDVMS